MAEQGQPSSVSDAGVGALCARAAVMGAYLNVQINAASLKGNAEAAELVQLIAPHLQLLSLVLRLATCIAELVDDITRRHNHTLAPHGCCCCRPDASFSFLWFL